MVSAYERIGGVESREEGDDFDILRQRIRQVFRRMDGDVGISLTDGIVEFSRKDISRSFAVQERNLLVLVAVRFQVFDLVGEFREVLENLLYLQSGETAASCNNSNLFIHL